MSIDLGPLANDFASVFANASKQTLRTALGRTVQANADERLPLTPPAMDVNLKFEFKDGGRGSAWVMMMHEDGSLLADLMMMGDGKAPWTEEHSDALKELGSQIAGSLSSAQGERFGKRLSFSCSLAEGSSIPDDAFAYCLVLEIQGFGEKQLVLSVGKELAESWATLDTAKAEDSQFPSFDEFEAATATGQGGRAAGAPAPAFGLGTAGGMLDSSDPAIQRLLDVQFDVIIELGQTELSIRRILEIGPGSIVELDRMAGEPVDLLVNDKIVAKGEVVVIEENFGIRITQLVSPEERLRQNK